MFYVRGIILGIATIVTSSLSAATITVDLNGGADYTDIQAAIDAAKDGDTVLVGPGEYLACSPLTFRGKAIEVRSEGGPDRTVIRRCEPPDAQEEEMVLVFRDGEGEGSVLRGFTLAGYAEDLSQQPFGLRNALGGGILFEGTARPALLDCVIAGHEADLGGGIACRGSASPTISRCTISHNSALGGGGVFVEGGSPIFEDCAILGNAAHAPDTGGGGVGCVGGSPRFVRCRIAGNFGGCGSAVHVDDAAARFENCLIYGHPVYATEGVCWGCREPFFVNCTIAGNEWDTPVCHGLDPSLFLGCILSSHWEDGSRPWEADRPNLSDRDPLFVGEGTFARDRWEVTVVAGRPVNAPSFIVEEPDYHLRPGSPAIDAGIPDGAPATDFEGRPRPCGAAVDLGAYEFGGCAVPARFRRGDSNADGTTDISDTVAILGFLFLGSTMNDCKDAADVNDDGKVDISDPVRLLGFLFLGSERPPDPFGACGVDSSGDELDCRTFRACP